MKKGLLLTAFLITLVLDMGVGPVTIVFGAANLSKNSAFPAATWLMVRGILNVVQFLTVISICWLVIRNKGKFSRKEESLFIAHILTTHPLAYFYYLIILGGVVWNILGSCWIGSAFAFYSVGFSACYLVCVILSWVSVIMSPLFVIFGGVSYSRFHPSPSVPEIQTSDATSEVAGEHGPTSVLQLLQDAKLGISVDQILTLDARNRRMQQPLVILSEEEKPITITELPEAESETYDNPLLEDIQRPTTNGITLIHRDVLDNEAPTHGSAWNPHPLVVGTAEPQIEAVTVGTVERNVEETVEGTEESEPRVSLEERQEGNNNNNNNNSDNNNKGDNDNDNEEEEGPRVVVQQDNLVMGDQGGEVIVVVAESVNHHESPNMRSDPIPVPIPVDEESQEGLKERREDEHTEETPVMDNKPLTKKEKREMKRREKEEKKKKKKRSNNPKENVVVADLVIPERQTRLPDEFQQQNGANDEFIDISSQMIHEINTGYFDRNVTNANVHVTTI